MIFLARSRSLDLTALGVAMAAGRAVGVWDITATQSVYNDPFLPTTTEEGCLFSLFNVYVALKVYFCSS